MVHVGGPTVDGCEAPLAKPVRPRPEILFEEFVALQTNKSDLQNSPTKSTRHHARSACQINRSNDRSHQKGYNRSLLDKMSKNRMSYDTSF